MREGGTEGEQKQKKKLHFRMTMQNEIRSVLFVCTLYRYGQCHEYEEAESNEQ